MAEPTFYLPQLQGQIKQTESPSETLRETARRDFEKYLKLKSADFTSGNLRIGIPLLGRESSSK